MAKFFREIQDSFEVSVGYEGKNDTVHIRDYSNNYHAKVHIDSAYKYINFLEDINNGICSPKRGHGNDICTGNWASGDRTWAKYLDSYIDGYGGNWLMGRRLPDLLEFLYAILPEHNIKINYKPLDISEITRDKLNEMSLSSLSIMYKRLQNEHRD